MIHYYRFWPGCTYPGRRRSLTATGEPIERLYCVRDGVWASGFCSRLRSWTWRAVARPVLQSSAQCTLHPTWMAASHAVHVDTKQRLHSTTPSLLCLKSAMSHGRASASILGGYQNYGPLLGPLNTMCRIIKRSQKRTIVLTATHMITSPASKITPSVPPPIPKSGPDGPQLSLAWALLWDGGCIEGCYLVIPTKNLPLICVYIYTYIYICVLSTLNLAYINPKLV